MSDLEDFTETEQLLLMSAAVQRYGPTKNLGVANTWNVVKRVLLWTGEYEKIGAGYKPIDEHPEIMEVYTPLIRMLSQEDRSGRWLPPARLGEALFQGNGGFGQEGRPLQEPMFTSCRLTKLGWQVAKELLQRHPEYCR